MTDTKVDPKNNSKLDSKEETKVDQKNDIKIESKEETKPETKMDHKLTNILNVFQVYYRSLFNKNNKEKMFDEINYEDETSTNRSMELLYEFIHECQENMKKGEDYITIYDDETIDDKKYDKLYGLLVNGSVKYVCPVLYPMIVLLAEDDLVKWKTDNWKIMKIKDK